MGNHEYCEKCGESDFHLWRPCDPEKVAKIREEKKKHEDEKQLRLKHAKTVLDNAGIKYWLYDDRIYIS